MCAQSPPLAPSRLVMVEREEEATREGMAGDTGGGGHGEHSREVRAGGPCSVDVDAVRGGDNGHREREEVGGDRVEGIDELVKAHAARRIVTRGGRGVHKLTKEDSRRVVARHRARGENKGCDTLLRHRRDFGNNPARKERDYGLPGGEDARGRGGLGEGFTGSSDFRDL